MFQRVSKLRKNRNRILGLNERYLEYIRPNNLSRSIDIADDKVLTKKLLKKAEIPVPKQIATIESRRDLDNIDFEQFPNSFVLKPVHGLRGGGVEIFYNRDKNGKWIKGDGARSSVEDLKSSCRDILDGKYSLHNEADIALIEERIRPHKTFRYHSYKGAPDVRVIVYNKIPVMAMLRLPTQKSNGKANLDLGGIGAGIDIAEGKTTNAIYGKSGGIEKIPHTRLQISGLKIPYWNRILEYSIKASECTGLGFAGVDLLIDKENGPVIIEVNARPGLSIQLANSDGLRKRLRKAGGIKVLTAKKGIRLAKDLFGGEIEEEIEAISGKKVVGIYETIELTGINGKTIKTKAKIDTGADSTSIDKELAIKLGYGDVIEEFEKIEIPEEFDIKNANSIAHNIFDDNKDRIPGLIDIRHVSSSHGLSLRPYIDINLNLNSIEFKTKASIFDRSKLSYKVIVGRKSLNKFLVEPSRK